MIKRYGLLGTMKLFASFIYTKLFYPKARLIRLPFDVRNGLHINFGSGLTTGIGCRLEAYPLNGGKVMRFGNNVQLNDYVHITAAQEITIGNNVLIASKVYISDCSHGSYSGDQNDSNPNIAPANRRLTSKPVVIEDNVWLGEHVSILPGVRIGFGSIVGANSVVTKDVPKCVVAVGCPAKAIKRYNFETGLWDRI